MLENILVAAAFMMFELLVLVRWLKRREQRSNAVAWAPFRKMLLDAVVHHTDDLMGIVNGFERELEQQLEQIRVTGVLTIAARDGLVQLIDRTRATLQASRHDFFNIVQTVAPSMQPYAAGYCNEVLWFGDGVAKALTTARTLVLSITEAHIQDNSQTSHALNGVSAQRLSILIWRDGRFAQFKTTFVQTVWKRESLYYSEVDDEFLSHEDYSRMLDTQKSVAELNQIPRTSPIKSFFDRDAA